MSSKATPATAEHAAQRGRGCKELIRKEPGRRKEAAVATRLRTTDARAGTNSRRTARTAAAAAPRGPRSKRRATAARPRRRSAPAATSSAVPARASTFVGSAACSAVRPSGPYPPPPPRPPPQCPPLRPSRPRRCFRSRGSEGATRRRSSACAGTLTRATTPSSAPSAARSGLCGPGPCSSSPP